MTAFSPSATAILAELQLLGIDVKPHGDVIRYRPRQAMTPALLQRLQTHKAELLAMLMIQQVHDLAEVMGEAWQERLAICTADDIPLAEAEQTAMKQLQAMIGQAKGRPVKRGEV
jgi:TubC N-terminal docking domain